MSRPQFFIASSAVIFLLERALPALTSWPLFLFLVFVILFVLTSRNDVADLPYVAAAAVFFDFFSGRQFGFFALTLLAVCLLIHLFKGRISINTGSFFSLFFYSLIFILGFLALLSFRPGLIIISWLPILIETAMITFLAILFLNVFRKIQN